MWWGLVAIRSYFTPTLLINSLLIVKGYKKFEHYITTMGSLCACYGKDNKCYRCSIGHTIGCCEQSVHTMGSLCTHYGQPMHTLWAAYAHTMGSLCTHYRQPMHTLWAACAHTMGSLCTHYRQPMHTLWAAYAHTMGSLPPLY